MYWYEGVIAASNRSTAHPKLLRCPPESSLTVLCQLYTSTLPVAECETKG
jgi:hypothetical protein